MRPLILAGLLALAGCTTYAVRVQTETEFFACYDPILMTRQQVAENAARHCRNHGLASRPLPNSGQCRGGLLIAQYECVTPPVPAR